MKTKIATILAVVLFLAVLSTSGTNAQRDRTASPAPTFPSNAVMTLPPGQPGFESNYGKITRLYPDQDRVYFRLGGGRTAMNPLYGYYFISRTDQNYQAMRDILQVAAVNRLNLQVQTKSALVGGYAEVIYLVLDF